MNAWGAAPRAARGQTAGPRLDRFGALRPHHPLTTTSFSLRLAPRSRRSQGHVGMPLAREEKGPSSMSRVASPTRVRLAFATDSDERVTGPPSITNAKGGCRQWGSRLPFLEAQRAVEPLQPNPPVPVQSQRRRGGVIGRTVQDRPCRRADQPTPGFSLRSIGRNPEIRSSSSPPTEK